MNTVLDTSADSGGDLTGNGADHEWTGIEERYCDHHRDVGAHVLADLLGTTAPDVVAHMGALGVEVPPVPLLGSTCPMCGGRMPVAGEGAARGVCDACNARLRMEARASMESERRVRAVASRMAMAEWRDGDGQGLSEVRPGGARGD